MWASAANVEKDTGIKRFLDPFAPRLKPRELARWEADAKTRPLSSQFTVASAGRFLEDFQTLILQDLEPRWTSAMKAELEGEELKAALVALQEFKFDASEVYQGTTTTQQKLNNEMTAALRLPARCD